MEGPTAPLRPERLRVRLQAGSDASSSPAIIRLADRQRGVMAMGLGGGILLPGSLQAPPAGAKSRRALEAKSTEPHYAARRTSSAKLSFAVTNRPIMEAHTKRKPRLYTSVDADRPHAPAAIPAVKVMVEPPGIAPGSSPFIARAFIPIVPPSRDSSNMVPGASFGKPPFNALAGRPS